MTDSSDPRRPKSSRKKPSREPATLDLKATVIDDGAPHDGPQGNAAEDHVAPESSPSEDWQAVKPEDTVTATAVPPPEDVVASSEATLDSGAGADSIPPEASLQHAAGQETISPDAPIQEASLRESSPQEPPSEEPLSAGAASQDPYPGSVPPTAATERRGGAGAIVGAGLLGGLVGAGLVYGLQAWQASPAQDDPRIAQLEQRVNALRQAPAPAGQPAADTQALEGRIQALESSRGELDQRLQALQGTTEQAASQARQALDRPVPEPSPVQPAPQTEAALTDLSNRLSSLEEQVRTNAQNATNAANATQDLERRFSDLDRRIVEQDRRLTETGQRFAELDRQLAETNRRFADTDRRFGEQDQRLSALSQQAAENIRKAEAAGQVGTQVVLAGRLTDALRSGAPYAEVLDGVKKAGVDAAQVAPLEPFAAKGAPTSAALAHSFEPLETAILRESRGPAEDWTDKLLRMADKVVTVRPVNEQGSTGVPALVARIRQALERGDVVEAAAAWDSLPEPARRLSQEWGGQVKAVAQARQAAQGLGANALAALNRSTQ